MKQTRLSDGAVVVLMSLLVLSLPGAGSMAQVVREARTPIAILGDAQFTAENGVRTGTGTVADPFIISSWYIDASGSSTCIRIENVSSSFCIEDCILEGATSWAIVIEDAADGSIRSTCIRDSLFGIQVVGCTQFEVRQCTMDAIQWSGLTFMGSSGCRVEDCLFVIARPAIHFLEGSTNNTVTRSTFLAGCDGAVRLDPQCGGNTIVQNDFLGTLCYSRSYNRWVDASGVGNYWSKYSGKDENEDGIGDTPYRILGDTYEMDRAPAMTPFQGETTLERGTCGDS